MATCRGTKNGHCCWLAGKVCKHLKLDLPGDEIACGLLVELGSWEAVYQDARYLADVKPRLNQINVSNCADWPPDGQVCRECGAGE